MEEKTIAAPETASGPVKKVYKLRMLMSVIYGFLILPLSLVFFSAALFTYNTGDVASGALDWLVFWASMTLPFVLLLSFVTGIWCARGIRSSKKSIVGKVFLLLPIVNIVCIALMYV